MPRVSLVTPCFNNARFVGETIESVLQQTLEDWELIVVDDGSTDESGSIIESFVHDKRVRLLTKVHGGVAGARNYGFLHTSGEADYLLFLDADDTIDTRMLELMVGHLDGNRNAGLVSCGFVWIDEQGKADYRDASCERLAPRFPLVRRLPDEEVVTPFPTIYAAGGLVPTMSTVFRRSVYEKTTGFDEAFGQGYEDSDLVLRAALSSEVHFVKERLYRYRRRRGQHSSDLERQLDQREKLFSKLLTLEKLTPEERARVAFAENFRRGPYAAFLALRTCRVLWRKRQWFRASRGLVRALSQLVSRSSLRVWLSASSNP